MSEVSPDVANINDTNNTLGKLENQWDLLREADIDERDRQAIREFVRLERQRNQNRSPSTLYNDLTGLRNASSRAETPIVDMDIADVRELFETLCAPEEDGGYGVKGGLYNYERALTEFFNWLDDEPDCDDYGFADRIETSSQSVDRVNEDQMLTQEEVTDLKQAATNARDKALIEFLADTGARISLASQLRVGDIYGLDTDQAYYKPNPNGVGHKDAPDKRYPIIYSQSEVREYINRHHIDPRDEAPLWHILRGYDESNPEAGAVSGDRIRDMLRSCRDRCDVEKPVNPHNFRHSAITRLSKTGHTPQQIKHVAGWADDRMLDAYDHTTDVERNDELRAKAGIIEEDDAGSTPPTPTTCGNCRARLGADERFCSNCGAPVTPDARDAANKFDDAVFQSAAAADGELVEALEDFRELVDEHPTLRTVMLED